MAVAKIFVLMIYDEDVELFNKQKNDLEMEVGFRVSDTDFVRSLVFSDVSKLTVEDV